jgi:hypothetical protein
MYSTIEIALLHPRLLLREYTFNFHCTGLNDA